MTELTRESLADSTDAIVAATVAVNVALKRCGLSVPEAHVTCLLVARLMREGVAAVECSDHAAIAEFIEREAAEFRRSQTDKAS